MSARQDKKKSSNELWTGDKSDVSHFRKFECLIHVHISAAKRNKLNSVSFQRIFVDYHSSTQMRIFDPKTKKIQWHTVVKFLEDFSDGKLLGNSRNNQKNEKSSIEIFDDENENEENENVEAQNPREQSIFDVSKNPELVENNSSDPNRENRESHVTPINQKAKK